MLCPPFDPRLQRNRLIDRHPYKILDAPNILDDFYLHLLDWSVRDVIAVALGLEVYLWNARTEHISLLGGLVETGVPVTAVGWSGDGDTLVVGKSQGKLAVWNYATGQKTQEEDLSSAHQDRVGVVTFHQPHGYLTGCRDHIIREFDLRVGPRAVRQYRAHEQEVCGLAVAARGRSGGGDPHLPLFASGGNENCVMVWDQRQQRQPLWCWNDHKAAIRALAWSPHERHILASGGGTADQTIRIRNAKTGTTGQVIETGSQVCNVIWSHTSSELVSAHGYSQHHIALWSYPDFKKIATLTGHRTRVLNSALSPDGENLVTAAADETLRFWKVFKPPSRPSANVALIHQLRALR
ncbi:WD40-repeat-containing domain protein [Dimargaris cristalligena]|uniref:WD40-repeat-containing domain protein n=1 Tax=Dimargaris cristalligena TaxID=215637 RepID=A0A4Q0A2S2_9FUNG|nr:WD40-repeat-containing domain protein [Dimargaris cristalligena]|eukprot:RKP40138.1 WD40-repeat-containing domain protein [Dimargaris cristalligena]